MIISKLFPQIISLVMQFKILFAATLVTCCLISGSIALGSLWHKVDEYLKQTVKPYTAPNILVGANKWVKDHPGEWAYFGGITSDTLGQYLRVLEAKSKGQHCDGFTTNDLKEIYESWQSADLDENGPLSKMFNHYFALHHNNCAPYYLSQVVLVSKYAVKFGPMLDNYLLKLAEQRDVCLGSLGKTDPPKEDWQYNCLSKVESVSAVTSARVLLNLLATKKNTSFANNFGTYTLNYSGQNLRDKTKDLLVRDILNHCQMIRDVFKETIDSIDFETKVNGGRLHESLRLSCRELSAKYKQCKLLERDHVLNEVIRRGMFNGLNYS